MLHLCVALRQCVKKSPVPLSPLLLIRGREGGLRAGSYGGKGMGKRIGEGEGRGGERKLCEYLYLTEHLLFIKALVGGAERETHASDIPDPLSSFTLRKPVKPQNYKHLQLGRNISTGLPTPLQYRDSLTL